MKQVLPRLLHFALFAALTVTVRAAVVLSIDVNDAADSPADTAPGFTPYFASDETLNVSGFSVDLNPAGGALLDDVHRSFPGTTGTLTLGALYRDSLFASANNTATYQRVGLDAVISGLTPGKQYALVAWSYDSGLAGSAVSDWSVLGLGGPQFAANNYTFAAAPAPTTDAANRISVSARADEAGRLILRGRQNAAATTPQVFLNGFTVDEQAEAPLQAEPVLALDFNMRPGGAANTQAGFQEFILSDAGTAAQSTPTTRTYGAYVATLTPAGAPVSDRLRTLNDSGPFTDGALLRDFIFGNNSGLDLKVQGLPPNRACLVELWSFDTGSPGARVSDWTVNGGMLWDDYTFNGLNLPTTNNDSKMAGTFTTTAAGEFVISGRLVSGTSAVFLNAIRISLLNAPVVIDFGHPIISEFLARNSGGILDEDGLSSDWIEIWNTTPGTLDLAGWRLTNNANIPNMWIFPAGVSIPSQGRLRVWASGKNRKINPAALHTNFELQGELGGFLGLVRPDATIASSYTGIPQQYTDTSYGVIGTAEPLTQGYFRPPTPGAPNGTPVPGFVADTVFDVDRGYYAAPFNVHITCATPGAQIYYTKDGSEPTTSSTAYPGAAGIPVSTTTVLRAKAFAPPLSASNTDTQTYIFNAQVQNQPANPAGWPATWGPDSASAPNDVPANYEMDPAVVSSTLPGYGVTDALAALPALSVVMPPADFLTSSGIYSNPRLTGDLWERACSLEFIESDGSGFHTSAGIRIHGNSSRTPTRMQKHGFRLAFRDIYGDGRLDYKLYPETNLQSFNKLVLHGFFTDGWGLVSWTDTRYRPWTAVSFRDAFMKQSFADMGQARVSGRYAHLYINGLYWGIYRIGERVEDDWCVSHFGGLPEEWDVIAFGEPDYVRNGTATAWDSFFTQVNALDLTVPANYQTIAAQLDLANFADYYLLHVHGDAEDWPHHNGYAVRNRVAPGSKWQFVTWDQEIAFDPLVPVNKLSETTAKCPGALLQRLRTNAEFRLLFADRAHKHLNNSGALSLAKSQARWQSFATLLDKAIVAESARWGDTADETPYGNAVPVGTVYKRETDWLPQVNTVKNTHLPSLHNRANSNATITELAAQSLWPPAEPPVFSQFGGNVPVNYNLTMTVPGGTIYYTLNGTDPREAVTGNAVGTLYAGAVPLAVTCTVKARARNGSVWSALTEATFIVGIAASSGNLALTEFFYDPANPDHEFVELTNFSNSTIDLTDVSFVGITYDFADGTLLAPGERIVVARDPAAFAAQYGNGPRVAGQYAGALDNNGEVLAVVAANGADIVRFRYDNHGPWPALPADQSRALVLRSPTLPAQDPASWRMSVAAGGTPGGSDSVSFAGSPLADGDLDGVVALLEYSFGTSDAVYDAASPTVARMETFDIAGVPTQFLTLTAQVAPAADAAKMQAELSQGLVNWDASSASVIYLGESVTAQGKIARKWRATQPASAAAAPQFFRIRVELP